LAICFWLLLHRTIKQKAIELPTAQMMITNQPQSGFQKKANEPAKQKPRNPQDIFHALGIDTNSQVPIVEQMWQKPIDFYGKVIDENSNPVSGVSFSFRWTDMTAPNMERSSSTESDSGGLFSLRGKKGGSMTLWFSKEGYYSSHHGQMSFNYAVGPNILSPDPHNPVIFHLHKKGEGAQLTTSDYGQRLDFPVLVPRDGTPVNVDLLQRKTDVSGDLQLSQIKPDRSQLQQATNWSFHMSLSDGGFVGEDDAFQFEAPATGYESTVDLNFVKGEPGWKTQIATNYYIVFGQPPKYGWLHVDANIAQQTVFLKYAINPTGSRNLEPK
jgi:hypothetical protein